ncbi:MAG: CRISPR-associated protein Csx3 [Saprospiraceae bacterium]|nr:CRISPR-associated protein Csx3 [Saprospiraceae bacterium]
MAQVLKNNLAIEFDPYNPSVAFEKIAKAVHLGEAVWFQPIIEKTVGGQKLQIIEFEHAGTIPSDLFKSWDVRLDDFVSITDSDNRPIKRNIPVAIGGRGPIWFYAHLVIPFANNREVFIFNSSGEYICAYARRDQASMLGTVLKE